MDSISQDFANLREKTVKVKENATSFDYTTNLKLQEPKRDYIMVDVALKSALKQPKSWSAKYRVRFNSPIINNHGSLDSRTKDRISVNQKYGDDTIFENISVFKDLSAPVKRVSGRKDNFDAKSLLATNT